jgi:hypothetical protein
VLKRAMYGPNPGKPPPGFIKAQVCVWAKLWWKHQWR